MPLTSETPLPISEAPDFFQTIVVPIPQTIGSDTDFALLYCERETVIDDITFTCNTETGSATLTFAQDVAPATVDAGSTDLATNVAAVPKTRTTPTLENNIIPAGRWLNVEVDVSVGGDISGIFVQVRFRTRRN